MNSGSFKNLTLINLFGLYFILNTVPAFTYGFFFLYGKQITREIQVFLILALALFFISIGIFVGRVIAGRIKTIKMAIIPSPFRIILVSIPFIFLGLYYMISTKGYLALFYALNGEILEAVKMRNAATNALTQHSALYSLPFIYIFPALSLVSFLEFRNRKKRRLQKNRFLLLLMSVVFSLLAISYSVVLVQKYYLVQLGLFLLVGYSIANGARISYPKLIGLFAIGVAAISLLWAFYNQTPFDRLIYAPLWVLERLFYANLDGLIHYIKYHNDNSLLMGQSLPNTLGLLPYEPVSITKVISYKYIMTTEQIAAGLVGSHPTIFVGEILVNFSYVGCVVASLHLGIILGFINKYLDFVVKSNFQVSTVYIAVYAMLTIWSFEVVTGSLSSFLHYIFIFNEMILVTLFVLFCCTRIYRSREALIVN